MEKPQTASRGVHGLSAAVYDPLPAAVAGKDMTPKYCIELAAAKDSSRAGGKAANLARALSTGARVPAGFVLAREALAFFLRESSLDEVVRCTLAEYPRQNRAERAAHYADLSARVHASPIPQVLLDEVASSAWQFLERAPAGLAVRSSASAEDSARASYAGVFESTLCVSTVEGLWDGIRRCWCSSWSPRAADYAAMMGLPPAVEAMAVIVQEMVLADSAGVLFTADPLTGNPWRFMLNATWGLAQGLVAGIAPADRFVLEWDTGALLEKHIASKPTSLVAGGDGVHEVGLPEDRHGTPSLAEEAFRRLACLGLDLDRAFDRRVDIEWAVAGNDLYLLQVRPITALPAFFPHELPGSDAVQSWSLSDPAWYHTAEPGVRVVAPLFRDRWASELWLRHQPSAEKALPRPIWREQDINGYRYATPWEWGGPWQDRDRTERWLDDAEPGLRQDWLATMRGMRRACERAAEAQKHAGRAAELIPIYLDLYEREVDMQATVWAAPQSLGWICEDLLRNLLAGPAPDFAVEGLLQGLPCYSVQRTLAAQRLGQEMSPSVVAAFSDQSLDRVIPYLTLYSPEQPFLEEYRRFCFDYGLRPPTWPADWARWSFVPSGEWGQDVTQTLFAIRNSALGQGQDLRVVLETCARRRQESEAQLRAREAEQAPALVARLDKLLAWTRFWVPVLDDRKWHTAARVRLAAVLLQIGTLLVCEGLLKVPGDLLLFTTADLQRIAAAADPRILRSLYRMRVNEYERVRRLIPPQHLGAPRAETESASDSRSEPEVAGRPALSTGKVLVGQGFSPGRAVGVCRMMPGSNIPAFLDSLTAEHIIVAAGAQTWDVDWLSLLMVARGLVTVHGAGLHHAAQIARECALPFVDLPQGDATSIPDGARIMLDGEHGTVTILD